MKTEQNKENLKIIRNIIHDSLLGNVTLFIIMLMINLLWAEGWNIMSIFLMVALCISFFIILFWLIFHILVYINKVSKNTIIRGCFYSVVTDL